MELAAVILLLLLVGALGTLAVAAWATRGNGVQPYDVNPYVETPGDLDAGVMDTLMGPDCD